MCNYCEPYTRKYVHYDWRFSVVLICRDHAGGNKELSTLVPGLTFCGNDSRIDAQNKKVSNEQQFNVRASYM